MSVRQPSGSLKELECTFNSRHGRVSAFRSEGSEPTVLLLHGNSSCKEVFASLISTLTSHSYGILALDFPGHGASEDARAPEAAYSFPGYAEAVADVLREAAVERPIVVGWSLGGHVAMELAGGGTDVAGLMVMGSPPGRPSPEALNAAFHVNEATLLAGKANFDSLDAETYARAMLGTPDIDPFLLNNVCRTDGRARELMFSSALAGIGRDQRDVAADPRRLFGIVHGGLDPFVRLDYLQSLTYGRLWRDRVVVLEDLGHAPHWQAPAVFAPILLEFLRDVKTGQLRKRV